MGRIGRWVAVLALVSTASGCWWPMPGADHDRSGVYRFTTALSPATVAGLQPAWTATVAGAGDPVVGPDALVHVPAATTCEVVTLDPADGSERWRAGVGITAADCARQTPLDHRSVTALVIEDRIVAGATKQWGGPRMGLQSVSHTTVFDAATGAVVAGPYDGEPHTVRDQRVVGTSSEAVTGSGVIALVGRLELTRPDGTPERTIVTGASGVPSADHPATYVAGYGPMATAPGPTTWGGAVRGYSHLEERPGCGPLQFIDTQLVECPLWVTPIDSFDATAPVLGGQGWRLIFVGTAAGTVYAIDRWDGRVEWTAQLGAAVQGTPALDHGTLYVPTGDGRLAVFDAGSCHGTCTPFWEGVTDTGSAIDVQPTVAGGVVLVGAADGTLHAFDADGCAAPPCAPLASLATGGGAITRAPVVVGGRVYVVTGDVVRAYDVPEA